MIPFSVKGQELKIKKKKRKLVFYLDNKKVNDKSYTKADKLYNDFYLVKNEKWGVVNNMGNEVIECKYDSISYNSKGLFKVLNKGFYGIISDENKIIVDIKYQDIDHYSKDSTALVKAEDKWGILYQDSINFNHNNIIFRNPDQLPKFKDCDETIVDADNPTLKCYERLMVKFLYERLIYPVEAREKGIEGLVVMSFIITETGELIEPEIIREIGGGCGEEALRVIKKMDNWIPGKQDDEIIKTRFNLPVRFKLK